MCALIENEGRGSRDGSMKRKSRFKDTCRGSGIEKMQNRIKNKI